MRHKVISCIVIDYAFRCLTILDKIGEARAKRYNPRQPMNRRVRAFQSTTEHGAGRVASRRANRRRNNVKSGIVAQLTGLKPGRAVAQGASKRGSRAVRRQEEQSGRR